VPAVANAVDGALVAEAGGEAIVKAIRIEPQRRWRVFVVQHSHLDVGYTDARGEVLRHHLAYLDQALELAAQTDGWPDDARFRWNVESLLPLELWLSARPRAAVDELSARVREGRFEVCALPFGAHVEALGLDELGAFLRRADAVRDAYGFPVVSALQTDVPGAPLGL